MLELNRAVDITLALPAFNEEKSILKVLDQSVGALERLERPWEILVIDNHSDDSTPRLVEEYRKIESRVRMVVHDENKLYSGSCRTAQREAKGKYVAIMDTDGQFVASDLAKFIEKLEHGANFVIGWRRQRQDPLLRLIVSAMFNFLGKLWLGYPFHDLNCGIRMFDRKFIQAAEIKHSINMANPEFYVRAQRANLVLDEVEIQSFGRTGGQTTHRFSNPWKIFMETNRYFFVLRKELNK